jgi:adenylate kinase family enzyme
MPGAPRIHITGASGAGVSTLGAALARRLGAEPLDTDDVYWAPTDPPYRVKRERDDRFRRVVAAMESAESCGWVLSGSLDGWGDPLIPRFERVVFLETPTEVRLRRIAARERARYGAAIDPGGAPHTHHLDFVAFVAGYETGVLTRAMTGRHRARHEAWLANLPCPVVRLDGARPTADLVAAVVARPRPRGGCGPINPIAEGRGASFRISLLESGSGA